MILLPLPFKSELKHLSAKPPRASSHSNTHQIWASLPNHCVLAITLKHPRQTLSTQPRRGWSGTAFQTPTSHRWPLKDQVQVNARKDNIKDNLNASRIKTTMSTENRPRRWERCGVKCRERGVIGIASHPRRSTPAAAFSRLETFKLQSLSVACKPPTNP